MALASFEVCMVLCEECVVDGNYQAVVGVVGDIDARIPVIVISRTGEWPEYLAAIRGGALDYVAFPPIPREFQRVIRNAFRERECRQHFARIGIPYPECGIGEMA